MDSDDLKSAKDLMLRLVPPAGKRIGNIRLQERFLERSRRDLKLRLRPDDYWLVRSNLINEGLLEKGRGRGGSVARTDVDASSETLGIDEPKRRKKEGKLYAPFHSTISTSYVKDNGIEQFVSQITANQGRKDTGGPFTRPDVTLIAVRSFAFVPGRTLEIVTFEIKPKDHFGVYGVYETAGHSAFANLSYLAIEVSNPEPEDVRYERVVEECERFGIGLMIFTDPGDWTTFDEVVTPKRKIPDPANISKFITKQMNEENKRKLQTLTA